jgi:hypothetical protein
MTTCGSELHDIVCDYLFVAISIKAWCSGFMGFIGFEVVVMRDASAFGLAQPVGP